MLWQMLFNVSDAGLSVLLVFFYHCLKLFQSICGNNVTATWVAEFPHSLQRARDVVIGNYIRIKDYIICPKCHSLYDLKDCIVKIGSISSVKECQYVPFPHHPMESFHQACRTPLLRRITSQSKADHFQPFKVYSYQSLKDSISRLLRRKGFLQKCEQWRNRVSLPDYVADIYDGEVWNSFQDFLSQQNSWCLSMNVDWFQPFSHVADSIGAIYLVILNLPRQERYKKENMLLAGIIPGPKEPSLNINSYFRC